MLSGAPSFGVVRLDPGPRIVASTDKSRATLAIVVPVLRTNPTDSPRNVPGRHLDASDVKLYGHAVPPMARPHLAASFAMFASRL